MLAFPTSEEGGAMLNFLALMQADTDTTVTQLSPAAMTGINSFIRNCA